MRQNMKFFYIFLLVAIVEGCPSNDTSLLSFHSLYPNPDESTDIVITDGRLLDVTHLDVNTIVITDSGRLVFRPGYDVSIRAKSIAIKKDGELIIGSELCRFTNVVDISLHGSRTTDRSGITGHGEKYITVEDNGSLKLYGEDKMPWTKMTSTYHVPPAQYRHLTDDTVNSNAAFAEGLTMTVFGSNFARKSYKVYDLWKNNVAKEQTQVNKMVTALNGLAANDLVAISVQNYFKYSPGVDVSGLFDKIEEKSGMASGSLKLRTSGMYDAFALVFEAGTTTFSQVLDESIGKAITEARASIDVGDRKVAAVSRIEAGEKVGSNIDVWILTKEQGYPVIQMAHDVSSQWKEGDSIVITSTDYSWKHAEVRKIKRFPSANSIELDHELDYRHFGEIENNVDMRAEVALLTRNIRIHGELSKGCPAENENCGQFYYDTYGCHIKILQSFTTIHIEGVEIFHCGQPIDKGFYSIHFHMCADVTNKEAIVKRTSIHDGFRAVVIHGTYGTSETQLGVEVIENVAYNILGHCYFQEDGAEKATSFIGNLAASVKKVTNGFFSSDASKPSAYWITTPETKMVDNVAAGSDGFGAWYVFPLLPVGPSTPLDVYEEGEAFRTPIYTMDNNVFHSNHAGGLQIDNILVNEHGDTSSNAQYDARVDPKNPNSAKHQNFLYRVTAYKNRQINIWLRGGGFFLLQASGSTQRQYVSQSVILGETEGNNEYIQGYPHAFGLDNNGLNSFDFYLGIAFYDGPIWVYDTYLKGFKSKPNDDIVAGALGFKSKNVFSSSVVSTVYGLQFGGDDKTDENWVFDGNEIEDGDNGFGNYDGDEVATFRDGDGSVIKCPDYTYTGPYTVHKPEKFLRTDRSIYRPNWKMVWTTDMFAKIDFGVEEAPNTFNPASEVKRINRVDSSDVAYENCSMLNNRDYMAVTNRTDTYYYQFQYIHGFPTKMNVIAKGVERGQNVLVGVCLPEGTTKDDLTLKTFTPNGMYYNNDDGGIIWVDDLDTLLDDQTMSRLFLDGRMLYVHFTSSMERDPAWDHFDDGHCPGSSCPNLRITLNNAPTSYTPCFTATPEELAADISIGSTEECSMAKGTLDPKWGAGDTLSARDGGFREWGSWAECCNADSTNPVETTRVRTCTFPTPYGGGAGCSGETTETKVCDVPCPVNGVWSPWTSWDESTCSTGICGMKIKTRTCDGVANGGDYCKGCGRTRSTCNNDCAERSEWSQWSRWSDCSCSYGSSGVKSRTRTCLDGDTEGTNCNGCSMNWSTCENNCLED